MSAMLCVAALVFAAAPASAGTAASSGGSPGSSGTSGQSGTSGTSPSTPAAPAVQPAAHPVHAACAAPSKPGEMGCLALVRDDVAPVRSFALGAAQAPQGFGPADIQSAYDLPSSGGSGQTVAIVDAYDDPNAEADLAAYRTQFGLPACTTANGCFRKTDERGGTAYPSANADWAEEISLDLDMVSAACPSCGILLVEADSAYMNDLGAAVNEAVALGAKFVSNSYGGAESGNDPSYDAAYFHHPGVALTVSSGDNGYGVNYPASSPEVTAVGGTSLSAAPGTDRGWAESAWSGAGAGCSAFSPKPSVQHDQGCAKRTVADVAAVADPNTGLAVYDTYGVGGWLVVGGTSASSPIIAGVYALAGTPAADSLPRDYPYANADALNDIVTGSDGSCGSYLCTAQQGYDGPTGLGTPHGPAAFSPLGNHGQLTGTVTDAQSGRPLAGAKVTAGDGTAVTDAQGRYVMLLTPGHLDLTATAFGYRAASAAVDVAGGQSSSLDLSLQPIATVHVTGTVTDGSGHGWPLYTTITVPGDPDGPFHTDPATGAYDLTLPAGTTQQLTFTPVLNGYQSIARSVDVGTADSALNVSVPVDAAGCTAPGYAAEFDGFTQGFDAASLPDGWTMDDLAGNGATWTFDSPADRANRTSGSGGYAIVSGLDFPSGTQPDTDLTSPAADLSASDTPQLDFRTYLLGYSNPGSRARVDLSTDDGKTWQTVWDKQNTGVAGSLQSLDLPQAAHQSQVRVRFHFQGSANNTWQVDDVRLGQRSCAPQPGGLVQGRVTDANTTSGLDGVTVASAETGGTVATTAATHDAAVGDGFFTFFSAVGKHGFTAGPSGAARYTPITRTATVPANGVVTADFPLPAGRVVVSGGITGTVKMGNTKTATVTLKNTGGAPATVKLNQAGGGYALLTSPQGKPAGVAATTTRHALKAGTTTSPAGPRTAPSAAAAAWTYGPSYPTGISDNVVGTYDGRVYSVGGVSADGNYVMSLTNKGYVLDPRTASWTPIADEPVIREKADGAFIGGRLYVTGGWSAAQDGSTVASLDIYDPKTDHWSSGAAVPAAYAASGVTALDGRLYVVGGCRLRCGSTDVWAYTPSTDRWQKAASYPQAASWLSCGAISGRMYCAGGTTDSQSSTKGYVYDPATNAWSPIADMPLDVWGASYSAADGLLIVAGGASDNGNWIDEESYAYEAATDTWSALPSWNVQPTYRGGGACGFFSVGGGDEGPGRLTRVLAGLDSCEDNDLSWLSLSSRSVTLQPGASATVTATFDAAAASVVQPGDFTGEVDLASDTPYVLAPLPATLHVTPPATWGKVTGTVTARDCDGNLTPLAGASVQITTWAAGYDLVTGPDGTFSLWLDKRNNPLDITAYATGFQAVSRSVKVAGGGTTTSDFTLKSTICL